jgi:hypothetical protein
MSVTTNPVARIPSTIAMMMNTLRARVTRAGSPLNGDERPLPFTVSVQARQLRSALKSVQWCLEKSELTRS